MTYQVLARKLRPKKFQDVIGQSHITTSLQNALKNDRLGHAYIFSGTRGVGKTSIARIFAKALRCENRSEDSNPCGSCESCLDFETSSSMNVLEIDGASNNSVDDIRELIGNVQYLPSRGKYKIFIIDEVHMLSTSAFNALLKTLEEPPEHAIFILATTEPEKLLGTVLSRCQRFDFRNATIPDLVEHIKNIAKAESINFESDDLIKQICAQGKGSFRDTLSLLDQVLSFSDNGNINEETLVKSLGLARTSAIRELVQSILMGNSVQVSKIYKGLIGENISPKNILTSALEAIFFYIENIENKKVLISLGLVNDEFYDEISAAEMFWIYETLSKDSVWALDSLSVEKSCDLAVQKVSLRREFFKKKFKFTNLDNNNETQVVNSIKETELESIEPVLQTREEEKVEAEIKSVETAKEVVIEAAAPKVETKVETEKPMGISEIFSEAAKSLDGIPSKKITQIEVDTNEEVEEKPKAQADDSTTKEESPVEQSSKEVQRVEIEDVVVHKGPLDESWIGFLEALSEKAPASASNLEQGNIITPLQVTENTVSVNLGFSVEGKVFYDYLSETEVFKKLVFNIADYFKCDESNVNLNLTFLDSEEKKEANFHSRVEIKDQEDKKVEEEKKKSILTDPLIQQAESIFKSKIDKIVIDK